MTLSRFDRAALIGVFAISALQVVGFAIGSKSVRGLGLVTTASPLPFVFSAHGDLETFAQTFKVEMIDGDGERLDLLVDPSVYDTFPGAYNRRNAYGAVFSHGPVLAKAGETDILDAVLTYGFCSERSLLTGFGINFQPTKVVVESTPSATPDRPWRYSVSCP